MNSFYSKLELLGAKLVGAVRSKTIWLNGLFLLFLDQLPNILGNLAQTLPTLQPYLGDALYRNVSLFLILGNLYLRFKTKTPLEVK